MDFLSLTTEYESREEYFNNVQTTMSSFHNFYSSLQKSFYQYSVNSHTALELLFNNLMKFDNRSSHSKLIFDFYRLFEKHLTKAKNISNTFTKELIEPTELITNHLREKNYNELVQLKKIINTTIEQKKKYEISKHSYFDSCKRAEVQEKKVVDNLNSKNSNPTEAQRQHDILYKMRTEAEEENQSYKEEHKRTNDLFTENEKKYFPIINNLRDNEESRINFISFHFEKFIHYLEDFSSSLANVLQLLKDSVVKIKIDNDMKLYEEKFSYLYKNKERFLKEEYFSYDNYRRNIEAIINKNKQFQSNGVPLPSIDPGFLLKSDNDIKLEQNEEMVYLSLFSNVEMEKRYLIVFENKLKNDYLFARKVIDKMLVLFKARYYYKFDNYSKFIIFSDILRDITMNPDVQSKIFELNFAIIYIAEKTFYQFDTDQNKRIYMCKVLSDTYQNFKDKTFWMKLLRFKIVSILEQKTKGLIEKKYPNTQSKGLYGIPSIFFTSSSSPSKEEYDKAYEYIKSKELFNIIKDFLVHFSNFKVDMSNSNDIVIEICNENKMTNEQMSYFVSCLSSNMFTVKVKQIQKNVKETAITKKEFNYLNKQKIKSANIKSVKDFAILLSSAINFLNIKDHIKLITINKYYSTQAEKVIFKNFLLSNKNATHTITLLNHIKIWQYLLKYDKNSILYENVLKESETFKSDALDTIQLDVMRTPFDVDKEENRNRLKNNLVALCYKYQKIGYCQGMNYISAFFISITKSEEDSFQIFSSLLQKTNYGSIFENDFEEMKKYFYVFDRLISIYLPEVNSILRKNNVTANYYISPWLITLFTNAYSSITESQNPKILIRIIDLFILEGWNAILNIGLCLLKHFEGDIVKMKFEELLYFMINDIIIKYDFFQTNNYERFIELYERMKVPKGVISNIENEYMLQKKIIKQNEKEDKIKYEKENVTSI